MRIMTFAAAACLVAFGAPQMAVAQQTERPAIEGTLLTVSAEGKSEAAPDMATLSLGVVTEGDSAAAAMAENARRMTALTQALRRAGVAERDVQTSNLAVNPQYQYVENQQPRITGYQANNQVSARVRNLANVGRVVDGAVAAGGNTVNSIGFSHADPDAQLDAARRDAAQAARHRAELYASAFGLHVARIVAISEGGGYAPRPEMIMVTASRMSADAAPTPVAPGEITTSVTLSVTYELR
jgi:uncharacterized protein